MNKKLPMHRRSRIDPMRMKVVLLLLILFAANACTPKVYQEPPLEVYYIPEEPIEPKPIITTTEPPVKPFKDLMIVIDPGHGGEDLGTQSLSKPKYLEKHFNLATAKMLKDFLEQKGYSILLTRSDDTFIPLDKRAEFANTRDSKLFVSVHYNSAPSPEAQGIEVFYYRSKDDQDRSAESKILAQNVLKRVIKNTDAKSRGVKHGNLAVIRLTKMPAILIEGGFLTNDEEMQKLKDPSYLKQIAWGIAQGIDDYINR